MPEEKKGLNNTTIALMVSVALFFDVLQWLLAFIFMGWLVSIFALLTFYTWFKMRGMNFVRPKRAALLGGGFIIELIPIINILPAWTLAIVLLALDSKIKKIAGQIPGGNMLNNIEKIGLKSLSNATNESGRQQTAFRDYKDETRRRTGLEFKERPEGARNTRAGDPFRGKHDVTGDTRNRFAQAPEGKRKPQNDNENPFGKHDATGTGQDFGNRIPGAKRRNYDDVITDDERRKAA